MVRKRGLVFLVVLFMLFLIPFSNALTDASTVQQCNQQGGLWCSNLPEQKCANNFDLANKDLDFYINCTISDDQIINVVSTNNFKEKLLFFNRLEFEADKSIAFFDSGAEINTTQPSGYGSGGNGGGGDSSGGDGSKGGSGGIVLSKGSKSGPTSISCTGMTCTDATSSDGASPGNPGTKIGFFVNELITSGENKINSSGSKGNDGVSWPSGWGTCTCGNNRGIGGEGGGGGGAGGQIYLFANNILGTGQLNIIVDGGFGGKGHNGYGDGGSGNDDGGGGGGGGGGSGGQTYFGSLFETSVEINLSFRQGLKGLKGNGAGDAHDGANGQDGTEGFSEPISLTDLFAAFETTFSNENTRLKCNDYEDNDLDNLIDMDDPDCNDVLLTEQNWDGDLFNIIQPYYESSQKGNDGVCGDDNSSGYRTISTDVCEQGTNCIKSSEVRWLYSTNFDWHTVETSQEDINVECQEVQTSCHNINGGGENWVTLGSCNNNDFSSGCVFRAKCDAYYQENCGNDYCFSSAIYSYRLITANNNPSEQLFDDAQSACNGGNNGPICFRYIFDSFELDLTQQPELCEFVEGDLNFFDLTNKYLCAEENEILPPIDWSWLNSENNIFKIFTLKQNI
jgi:hypothetical protein